MRPWLGRRKESGICLRSRRSWVDDMNRSARTRPNSRCDQDRQGLLFEVTQAYLSQIEKWNGKINAYVTLNEKALELAKAADQKKGAGPLAGVPIAVKDNFCTEGLKTTAGSKILHNFVPPYSSTVTRRLEASGAITIGKTNMDEFAMGSSTETSHFGPTKNSWNLEYVPAGFERRDGGGDFRRNGGGRTRNRHRRIQSPAGALLRFGRVKADLRTPG